MRSLAILFALSTLAGCIEGELARKSIVAQWRAMSITATPPIARPGDDVRFDPLVVSPDGEHVTHGVGGVRFEWALCIRPDDPPGLGGLQYDPEDPTEGCDAADMRLDEFLVPAEDGSLMVPGFLSEAIWPEPGEVSEAARTLFGEDVSPEFVEQLLTTVGILVTVQLSVYQGDERVIRAYKRIVLVDRAEPGTNPPEPRFQIGDAWVSGREVEAPWTCEPEDGVRPVLPRNQGVIISPDPNDEDWLETYFVLDITATITEVSERPYYSFLSTAGSFDQETTRAPIREEIWTTPEDPGVYPLWVVVRDGHAGMTACRTEVEVE